MCLHPSVCKHHKYLNKYAYEHSSTREGEIILHCLNFAKKPSFIKSTGRRGGKNEIILSLIKFNEPYTVSVYHRDLYMDLYGHVCGGSFVLCVSAVIPCHVCDRCFPRRVKENGVRRRESVFYCKVNRQVKEAQKLSCQSESGHDYRCLCAVRCVSEKSMNPLLNLIMTLMST